jgi:hypothetical protein
MRWFEDQLGEQDLIAALVDLKLVVRLATWNVSIRLQDQLTRKRHILYRGAAMSDLSN